MLRKRYGQVLCLAPASTEGSVDGLGQKFAETFGTTSAEVEAAKAAAAEEVSAETSEETEAEQEEPAEDVETESVQASDGVSTEDLQNENHKLSGQVTLLTDLNNQLNSQKAQLQVELDNKQSALEEAAQANEQLKPAAVRQIQTLSVALAKPVDKNLTEKSASELGAMCSDLLSELKDTVPGEKQSADVPSTSGGSKPEAEVPTAKASGLQGL